jgi:predicted PurR-regulated permease PerM
MQIERMSDFISERARRAAGVYRSASSQPLLFRVLVLVIAVLIAIPLAAIIIALGLIAFVGVVVYVAGRRLRRWIRNLLPRDDGRENVRVIRDRA